jgi:hypothetical protein
VLLGRKDKNEAWLRFFQSWPRTRVECFKAFNFSAMVMPALWLLIFSAAHTEQDKNVA